MSMKTCLSVSCLLLAYSLPVCAAEIEIKAIEKTELKAVFGQVESRDAVTARARIGGTVTDLRVDEGTEVKPGDIIAVVVDDKLSIQTKAIDARMNALSAQLANAETDLQRAEQLARNGVVPKTQVDGYQTQVNVLNNQIAALKADRAVVDQQSAEGNVLAPGAGRVIAVSITKGAVLMPGEPVARIAGGGYFLRLALPERHAAQIVKGSEVLVSNRGSAAQEGEGQVADAAVKGKLVKIYPEIQGGRVIADVEVADLGNFFVGERTRVWIPVDKRMVIAVPQAALKTRYGIDYVTVAVAGQPADVAVVTGSIFDSANGPLVEVLSGIVAGDKVILP